MRPRRSLLLLWLMSLVTRGALGQTAAFPEVEEPKAETTAPKDVDPRRTEAEELIRQGVLARREGREQDALQLFERAYALEATPRARAQMALAAKSLRLYVEAEHYFNEALAATDDAWIRENRQTLEQARDLVDKQLGWLSVETQLPKVELLVNGRSLGEISAQAKARVPAGVLAIELRSNGFEPHQASVKVAAQSTSTLRTELEAVAPPAPTRDVVTPSPRAGLPTLAYVGGGVAIVGIAFGSYFGLRALSLKHDRDDLCPNVSCQSEKAIELDEDGRRAAIASTLSFGVAVAGIGTAVVALLTDRKQSSDAPRLSLAASATAVDLGYGFDF